MARIGFIGAGKMADALLAGILNAQLTVPWDVVACEKMPERRKEIEQTRGVITTDNPLEVVKSCKTIVLAVKPQDLDSVLVAIRPALKPTHLLISIAARKTLTSLQKLAGKDVRIVRVMPNLPLTVGEGMSVFCLGKQAKPADRTFVRKFLSAAGEVAELPEKQFDAVTALSGSGPAFFAYVMRAMVRAAVACGLDKQAAPLLALQTMRGTAKVLLTSGMTPDDFIAAVASPKGTTEAGLKTLESSDIDDVLTRMIRAASDRSKELGKS